MTNDDLHTETQRLLNLSDSIAYANREDSRGPGTVLIHHALNGCLALLFAAIPAWISSFFVELQGAIFVFCSMIVFYGCIEISNALVGQSNVQLKMLDNINALRPVLIDLSNRVQHSGGSSKH